VGEYKAKLKQSLQATLDSEKLEKELRAEREEKQKLQREIADSQTKMASIQREGSETFERFVQQMAKEKSEQQELRVELEHHVAILNEMDEECEKLKALVATLQSQPPHQTTNAVSASSAQSAREQPQARVSAQSHTQPTKQQSSVPKPGMFMID
jgi:chromosome segregation ATPase